MSIISRRASFYFSASAQPGCVAAPERAEKASPREAQEIAREAYIYLYPLVIMDVTRRQMTNLPSGKLPGYGPMNTFNHMREFPDAANREAARPNFNVLYSVAWLDLTREPMIISAPDTGGRYYLMEMTDMWTDTFAVPGKRTSGTGARKFAVVPQGWAGELPEGITRIESPSPYVFIANRIQASGGADYDAVHKLQDCFLVAPLSQMGKQFRAPTVQFDPTIDMKTPPKILVGNMDGKEFFTYAAGLMNTYPPHPTDWSQLERMKKIGMEAGKEFDYARLDNALRQAVDKAPPDGIKIMKAQAPKIATVVNGWQTNRNSIGVYGNFYMKRAIVAMAGLVANQPEDAVYAQNISDASGNTVVGGKNYVLHFNKGELPPVSAFWSLTMYDGDGFQVANPLNRFTLGSGDPLKFNADGSLDLYIRSDSPGADKESNWLPSPARGETGMTLRLYAPQPEVLEGNWNPPAIKEEIRQ